MIIIEQIKAEIERLKAVQFKRIQEGDMVDAEPYDKIEAYNELISFLSTLESEKPMNMEDAIQWLVDDDYHEASEKGRFILGSVGLGYNGYYIPYLDLLKLPKED